MSEPKPDDNTVSKPAMSPETVKDLKAMARDLITTKDLDDKSRSSIDEQIQEWQTESGKELKVEMSEFGYPIVDLSQTLPEDAMSFLRFIEQKQEVVYHGMHNNEFRRQAGMADVVPWMSLDPALSHQPEGRKAVYATKSLEGGIAHATIEHKPEDIHDGETYALKMNPKDGKLIEVSPQLQERIQQGGEVFTDGLLYVLPAESFQDSKNSSQEVNSSQKTKPLMVVRVGKTIGRAVITSDIIETRGSK